MPPARATVRSPSPRSPAAPTPPTPRCCSPRASSPARPASTGWRRRPGSRPRWRRARRPPRDYLRAQRSAHGPGGAGLRHRRLRLHHLHRQFRPARAGHGRGHPEAGRGRGGRALGQPQLPGPRPRHARSRLPGLAAARGRLRARRAASTSTSPRSPSAWAGTAAPVFLADIWPAEDEIDGGAGRGAAGGRLRRGVRGPGRRCGVVGASRRPSGPRFPWDPRSTYLRRPPFVALPDRRAGVQELERRADHRARRRHHHRPHLARRRHPCPGRGGALAGRGRRGPERPQRVLVPPRQFRGHAARPVHQPLGPQPALSRGAGRVDRSMRPRASSCPSTARPSATDAEGVPTVILAGRHYGAGSSRDWAAKGTALLGARAVLANSFERIHRSNLIGMGVLPLELPPEHHPAAMALRPGDRLDFTLDLCGSRPVGADPGPPAPRVRRGPGPPHPAARRDHPRLHHPRRRRPDPAGAGTAPWRCRSTPRRPVTDARWPSLDPEPSLRRPS